MRAEPKCKRYMKTRRSKYHTSETARDMADRNVQMGGSLKSMTAGDLGAIIKALVERTKIDPERIDDVAFGQGYGNGEAPGISRWSALAAGLPESIPGVQIDRRCGSGLQAVIDTAMRIRTGAADMVIAGGVESMSNVEYYSIDHRWGGRLTRPDQECSPSESNRRDA